ncbi:MAG: hypothetical protein ACKVOU_04425 [Cytophagales bacterium]
MKLNSLVRVAIAFLFFMAIQIFWVKEFAFFQVAFCFVYISILISLPTDLPMPFLLFIAFCIGFSLDLFYDTLGIHASACVSITYFRPAIVRLLTPLGGYDDDIEISIRTMGIRWYTIYVLVIVFVHLFILFFLEAGGFHLFYWTLAKVFASLLLTSFFIISLQFLFFSNAKP